MSKSAWIKELSAEIMVCDTKGVILDMNDEAAALFSQEGGTGLLGKNILDCHPEPSLSKLTGLMEGQESNAYYNTEGGEKRFFFQSPWFQDSVYSGFVEISFRAPENIPHFIRG